MQITSSEIKINSISVKFETQQPSLPASKTSGVPALPVANAPSVHQDHRATRDRPPNCPAAHGHCCRSDSPKRTQGTSAGSNDRAMATRCHAPCCAVCQAPATCGTSPAGQRAGSRPHQAWRPREAQRGLQMAEAVGIQHAPVHRSPRKLKQPGC